MQTVGDAQFDHFTRQIIAARKAGEVALTVPLSVIAWLHELAGRGCDLAAFHDEKAESTESDFLHIWDAGGTGFDPERVTARGQTRPPLDR